MPFSRAGNQGRVVGVDDRIEQAREAAVDVFLAELRVAPGALDALGDQPRLAHYASGMVTGGGHLTGWDLAPATAIIGLGQGMALPSLIGASLAHVPPERAGAAAGILTTAQQFGVASGVAVIGAVFYARLGVTRASSVSAMELAIAIDAVILLATAGLTMLLPRRSPGREPAVAEEAAAREPAEYSAGAAR
jgi:hypothetical protein